MNDLPRELQLKLVCKTLPTIEEPALVGIQDKKQNIHEGTQKPNGSIEFNCTIQLLDKGGGKVDFAGPFIHGPGTGRFVYLSWKYKVASATPWIQRVKIPLVFKAAELVGAKAIQADITGRRPHASEPINWKIIKKR